MKIQYFGQLKELFGSKDKSITISEPTTVAEFLTSNIYKHLPSSFDGKLLVAVNDEVVDGEAELRDEDFIAIMPPFSGGAL